MSSLTLVLAAVLAGSSPKPISVTEAARTASLIVVGTVERVEIKDGRAVGLLSVEDVVKGTSGTEVRFYAAPRNAYDHGPRLGARELLFLQSGSREPTADLEVIESGKAAFRIERGDAVDFVHVPIDDFDVEPDVCGESVDSFRPTCRIALPIFAARVLGVHLEPNPKRSSHFRIVQARTCRPCDVEELFASLRRTSDVRVCPVGNPRDKPEPFKKCVRESARDGAPFLAREHLRGVDSQIESLWVLRDGALKQFRYDSSVEGGGDCSARIDERSCRTVAATADEKPLECVDAGPPKVLCAQFDNRVLSLSPPGDARTLACGSTRRANDYEDCSIGHTSTKRPIRPDAFGPDLICSGRPNELRCRAEQ